MGQVERVLEIRSGRNRKNPRLWSVVLQNVHLREEWDELKDMGHEPVGVYTSRKSGTSPRLRGVGVLQEEV